MKNKKIWVIKAGSQMVIDGGPLLIRDWMQQVKCLKTDYNIEVIWVTSGAIATARRQSESAASAFLKNRLSQPWANRSFIHFIILASKLSDFAPPKSCSLPTISEIENAEPISSQHSPR